MATAVMYYRDYTLPWERSAAEEERFRAIAKQVVIAFVVLAVAFTLLPVPPLDRNDAPSIPPRLAKLVIEKKVVPPPPPVVLPKPELPQPTAATKPVERKPESKPDAPVVPVTSDRKVAAREKAKVAGLLPFVDELADLRDNRSIAGLASNRPLTGAVGEGTRSERSLITSKAGQGSGGINTAAFSRDTGGAGLGGRGTTQVTSTLGGMSGSVAAAEASASAGGRASRSREEIEMVFDQNKGAIYALYSRALRKDPSLQGKLVLKLTIEPGGEVSNCEVVSSELADDELLAKLVARVKMFRFPDRDVATVTTTKPIDFFPA